MAILDASPHAWLGVGALRGPHLTPQVMASAAGRIWFVISADSAKAKLMMKRPAVSIAARGPDRLAVVIRGDAAVLDVAHPFDRDVSTLDSAMAPLGLAGYLLKRRAEVARIATDLLSGQLTSASKRRVLVSVQPDECELLEVGPREQAALAWTAERGIVTVPVEWDGTGATARLGPAVLELLAGSRRSAAAALALDRSSGPGMADRAGAMYRGPGRLSGHSVRMKVERITCWEAERVYSQDPT